MKYTILVDFKDKNHVILSTDAGKAHDKIQYPLMLKTVKVGRKENFLKLIKDIY